MKTGKAILIGIAVPVGIVTISILGRLLAEVHMEGLLVLAIIGVAAYGLAKSS